MTHPTAANRAGIWTEWRCDIPTHKHGRARRVAGRRRLSMRHQFSMRTALAEHRRARPKERIINPNLSGHCPAWHKVSVFQVSRTEAQDRGPVPCFSDSVRETWRMMLDQPTATVRFFRGYRCRDASKVRPAPVRDHGTFRPQFTNLEQSPSRQHIQTAHLSSPADPRNIAHRHKGLDFVQRLFRQAFLSKDRHPAAPRRKGRGGAPAEAGAELGQCRVLPVRG
jgi:hypothetical protein